MSTSGVRTVFVTDAHELAGMGAIRSLGRAGYRVVAGWPAGEPRPAGAWSRYVAMSAQYPDPWQDNEAFRDWLEEKLCGSELDAVLPVTEAAIVALAARRERVPSDVLLLLPDDDVLRYTLSKLEATRRALDANVACPQSVSLEEPAPTREKMEELQVLGYPVVVKSDNYLDRFGVYHKGKTQIATGPREAEQVLRNLKMRGRSGLAQEFVPGHGAGAFFLRWKGRSCLSFTHRRIHEVPWTGGSSSLRESSRDQSLLDAGMRVLDAIDYEGVAMVEFRRAANGSAYFMEVNGRLWGSLALALHCGLDFPLALLECHRDGKPVREVTEYPVGVRCRSLFPGEFAYVLSVLRTRHGPEGRVAPSRFRVASDLLAHTLDPRVKGDWFWWSDPMPGIMQGLKMTREVIGKVIDRVGHRLRQWRDRRLAERLAERQREQLRQEPLTADSSSRILFVCYGNICRSAFAERWWKCRREESGNLAPIADSAGFFPRPTRPTPSRIVDLAAERGISLGDHRSRVVDAGMIAAADIVVVMDLQNWRDVVDNYPESREKTYLVGIFGDSGSVEVEDPFTLEELDARTEFGVLETALEGLWEHLMS